MRIEHLKVSITDMPPDDFMKLLTKIRAIRRTKPTVAIRAKSAPAKTKRAPKTRMRQQDMFAYANGLTDAAKLELLKKLKGN